MNNVHLFRKVESLKNDFQNVIYELIEEIELLEFKNKENEEQIAILNEMVDNLKD